MSKDLVCKGRRNVVSWKRRNIKNLEIEFLAVTSLVLICTPGRGGRGVQEEGLGHCDNYTALLEAFPPLCCFVVQYLHSAQFNIHTGPPVLSTTLLQYLPSRDRGGSGGGAEYGSDNYTVRPQQWHLPSAAAAPSCSCLHCSDGPD